MYSADLPPTSLQERPKYLERVEPLHFPVSAEVPETQLHFDLRTLLYQLLSEYLGESHTVGSDQFVYWDAGNPKRCIAPDVYAKAAPRGEPVQSWKVWERGAPDLAVEMVSDSDRPEASWQEKFAHYQTIGVKELVRLDLVSGSAPLRVWNRTQEVLSERQVATTEAGQVSVQSLIFNLHWVIAPVHACPRALRIATQVHPLILVPTAIEGREAERRAREAERHAKEAAEARVRELEALLRAKG